MRYRDAASFRQAIERRLKERATGDGARLAWDRKRVAFDRLLARLTVVAANRWMLKGGFALDLRMTERAGATKDIDLDWRDPEDELLDTLLDAVDHDAGDFFVFHVERAGHRETVSAEATGSVSRHHWRAASSRPSRSMSGSAPTSPTGSTRSSHRICLPSRVWPRSPCPRSRWRPRSPRRFTPTPGSTKGDRLSSRTKDLVDLVLIAELSALDAATLQAAIETTFDRRGTHPPPPALPLPPREWNTSFSELAGVVGIPTGVAAAHTVASHLLDPILSGEIRTGTWNSDNREWRSEH